MLSWFILAGNSGQLILRRCTRLKVHVLSFLHVISNAKTALSPKTVNDLPIDLVLNARINIPEPTLHYYFISFCRSYMILSWSLLSYTYLYGNAWAWHKTRHSALLYLPQALYSYNRAESATCEKLYLQLCLGTIDWGYKGSCNQTSLNYSFSHSYVLVWLAGECCAN